MAQDVNPIRSALYYPFPFIKDDEWLKSAALFWDSIYRIIPVGFSSMRRGASTISEPSDTERVFRGEFQFIKDYEIPPFGFSQVSTLAAYKLLDMIDTFPEYFSSRMESGEEYFSWSKLEITKANHQAVIELEKRGAIIGAFPKFRFKEFPGRVYMALLARSISEENDLPIVTDDARHDLILKSYLVASDNVDPQPRSARDTQIDRSAAPPKNLETAICNLTYEAIGIQNLSTVSIDQILKIRQKYDAERKAFADEVQNYVEGLQHEDIRNEAQLEAYLKNKADKLNGQRLNFVKAIRGIGIETCFDLAKVTTTLPIVGAMAKYMILSEPFSLIISGSVAIGALLFKKSHSKQKERASNPIPFYLQQLSKEVNKEEYFARVSNEVSNILKNKII